MPENPIGAPGETPRPKKRIGAAAQEVLALMAVVLVILAIPLWIHSHEATVERSDFPPGTKVFNLTGLGSQGIWTLEEVTGFNYWWKNFSRAQFVLDPGDRVGIRLQSADVAHIFYCPTLNLGPVYVEPGHVEIVSFRADRPGTHYYYCMSICGECHYFMRGEIVIGKDLKVENLPEEPVEACPHNLREPVTQDIYERGGFLFQRMGCIACHGEKGKGDIVNPNYVNRTIPRLNTLADRMFLYSQKTADRMAQVITEGKTPEEMEQGSIGIPQQARVMAKYRSVRDVIKNGRQPARSDTTTFVPPLAMPAWGTKLSEHDIDAILVFVLRNQVWQEKDD